MRPAILTSLLVFCLAAPAAATTVLTISLEKMTLTSDVILHGTVVSSAAVAVNGNERHIRTDVVVRIHSLLKGQRGMAEITLKMPGGRLGDYAMMIPGMPAFTAGQEVVLFLEKTSASWIPTGLSQGRFTVETGKDGRKTVRRNLDGVHFVAFDERGKFTAVAPPGRTTTQTLPALLAEVRRTLEKVRER